MTEKEFQDEFRILLKKFFDSNFAGKNIYDAVDETVTKALRDLMVNSIYFRLIYFSLDTIKNNKEYWYSLDRTSRNQIKQINTSIKNICEELDSILIPIIEVTEKVPAKM